MVKKDYKVMNLDELEKYCGEMHRHIGDEIEPATEKRERKIAKAQRKHDTAIARAKHALEEDTAKAQAEYRDCVVVWQEEWENAKNRLCELLRH